MLTFWASIPNGRPPAIQLSDAAMRRVVRGTEADYDKEAPKRGTPLRSSVPTTDLGHVLMAGGNDGTAGGSLTRSSEHLAGNSLGDSAIATSLPADDVRAAPSCREDQVTGTRLTARRRQLWKGLAHQITSKLGNAPLQELDEQARNRRFRLLFRLPPSELLLEKHDATLRYCTGLVQGECRQR